ncbi:hypothetical protein VD0002_g10059 [Verticillium dahliae]|uniref:Uncharacterized protein n=1 Tax=Verticillium dahliae TaxID=27337 RepID=A0AA44WNE8_VERDA|nr:hypothetical protein BJF96_g2951 [Verticillium dahliae]PNH41165.1 hypothetical protein VD0003_g10004 [Verticillium dahliae]PNH53748.1 hypothetical protein VD0002_g10059 [Verticillium dahliae]
MPFESKLLSAVQYTAVAGERYRSKVSKSFSKGTAAVIDVGSENIKRIKAYPNFPLTLYAIIEP